MANRTDMNRIEDEASLWAARLRGRNMTDASRAALSVWLEADPEHRWILGRYRELSAQLDAQLGPAVESLAVLQAAARRRRWKVASVALAAAAVVAISITLWSHRARGLDTKTGERHLSALADGSRVEMNAQTSLVVDFRSDERRVRLSRGEALFSVAKDAARPFIVETPSGVVRVTGTVFNVRAKQATSVEVTVLEGTVRLRAANQMVADEAVTPGRQAVMGGEAITVRELPAGEVQDAIAWRRGQAIFEDTPLGDALERFAAYQSRPLTVEAAAADLRIGGRYSLDDLDGLLRAVERLLPVRVLRGTDGAVRIELNHRPGR